MWIHVYPNWNTNFNSKKDNKRSYDTKASISLIPTRRTSLWCPIVKWNEITIWIYVYPNWKTYFNSKIGNKSSFSYEIKASILLIPTSRTCLWRPIMKWNEITIWIHVYLNWKTNFNSKIGNKRSFSSETKASISLIPTRTMCSSFQSWRERRLLCESMFIAIGRRTSILKLVIRKVFIMKPKLQYH